MEKIEETVDENKECNEKKALWKNIIYYLLIC